MVRSAKIDVKILAEVAVTVALGTVLSNIKIYQLPYGGSITLGSMVPLFARGVGEFVVSAIIIYLLLKRSILSIET